MYSAYAILDTKIGAFSIPHFHEADAAAIRLFGDWVSDPRPDNNLHKHPEDFALYRLASYDTLSGALVPSLPSCLITAAALSSLKSDLVPVVVN